MTPLRDALAAMLAAGMAVSTATAFAAGSGAQDLGRLYAAHQYEAIAELDAAGEIASPGHAELGVVCYAQLRLRDVAAAADCLDRLDRHIAEAGRTATFAGTGGAGGDAAKIDFLPIAGLLRARLQLLCGAERAAMATLEAVAAALGDGPATARRERDRIETLSLLGIAQALAGDRTGATATLRALRDRAAAATPPARAAFAALGAAKVQVALGDEVGAVAAFDAIAQRDAALRESGHDAARFALALEVLRARVLMRQDKLAEAKTAFRALIARPTFLAGGELFWTVLYELGRIARQEGQTALAESTLRQAIDLLEQRHPALHTEASLIGFVADRQAPYDAMIALLGEAGRASEALHVAERRKAGRIAAALTAGPGGGAALAGYGETGTLLAERDRLEGRIAWYAESGDAAALQQAQARADALRRRIEGHDPALAALAYGTAASSDALRDMLQAGETLLTFHLGATRLYSFVVNRDGVVMVQGKRADLDHVVTSLLQAIQRPDSDADAVMRQAAALYDRVLGPVAAWLTGGALTIAPDGVLHAVPWAMLPGARGPLVDRYRLRLLPTATALRAPAPQDKPWSPRLLALGEPRTGRDGMALAHGVGEAVAIARLWRRGKALTEEKATEATVKRFGGKFDLLHFAAPARYADDPLDSAIYLAPDGAGAAAGGDDGVLDMREIFALPLNADLVTLSGAALAPDAHARRQGDAVAMLGQGFLFAGASAVVTTLWELPLHARFTLMTSFYRFLRDSGPMDALRQAQQVVRTRYPHPAGWAGVQLYGLPGAPRADRAAMAQGRAAPAVGGLTPAAGMADGSSLVVLKGANLRAGPSTLAARVGSLPKGAEVQVMERVPDSAWLRVAQNGEPLGYIFGPLLAPATQ